MESSRVGVSAPYVVKVEATNWSFYEGISILSQDFQEINSRFLELRLNTPTYELLGAFQAFARSKLKRLADNGPSGIPKGSGAPPFAFPAPPVNPKSSALPLLAHPPRKATTTIACASCGGWTVSVVWLACAKLGCQTV